MSKTFQEACGFKLGDDLNISAAGGAVDVADVIVLRDVTAEAVDTTLELSDQDRPYWEWFLRESLGRCNFHLGVQFSKGQDFGSVTIRKLDKSRLEDMLSCNLLLFTPSIRRRLLPFLS